MNTFNRFTTGQTSKRPGVGCYVFKRIVGVEIGAIGTSSSILFSANLILFYVFIGIEAISRPCSLFL